MARIESITIETVDIPQKVVFETAKSRTDVAHALIVSIKADNGLIGRGEGTPAEYVTGETRETVQSDVALAAEKLQGWPVESWRGFCLTARKILPERRTACAALEIAMADLFSKSAGISMAALYGGAERSVVTDLTIPILPPEQARGLAEVAAKDYSCLKIKIGTADRSEDIERVRQVHLGAPEAAIRVDANQAFAPDEAVAIVQKLNGLGIVPELVEQPVPAGDTEGLRYVKERIAEPVIADESALDPPTVLNLLKADAVDGVNIKLMKAGITGALDIIALCRAAGLKLMIGCMLESPVGIGAAAHLACGTGAFDFLDLDADVLGKPTGIEQNYRREGAVLSVDL